MPQPTTRIEIADLIEDTLDGSARDREQLVTAARDAGARDRVIATLSSLPDREYRGLRELWQHLPEIQIEP
jgi:hypothetical protein